MSTLRRWKRRVEDDLGTPPVPVICATLVGYGTLVVALVAHYA